MRVEVYRRRAVWGHHAARMDELRSGQPLPTRYEEPKTGRQGFAVARHVERQQLAPILGRFDEPGMRNRHQDSRPESSLLAHLGDTLGEPKRRVADIGFVKAGVVRWAVGIVGIPQLDVDAPDFFVHMA